MGLSHSPSLVMDGLVFSIDAGNSRCYSGSGNTAFGLVAGIGGTLLSGAGFTSLNQGSFTFDGGANSYLTATSNSGITGAQARSICAWAKFNNVSSSVVCGLGDVTADFRLFEIQAFSSRLIGHRYGNFINGTTVLTTGVWYFTAYTYDGTTSRLYLNGNIEGTATETLNTVNTPFSVGKRGFNSNSNMSGFISNVQIYNRALSAQEIKQNYNATKKRYGL